MIRRYLITPEAIEDHQPDPAGVEHFHNMLATTITRFGIAVFASEAARENFKEAASRLQETDTWASQVWELALDDRTWLSEVWNMEGLSSLSGIVREADEGSRRDMMARWRDLGVDIAITSPDQARQLGVPEDTDAFTDPAGGLPIVVVKSPYAAFSGGGGFSKGAPNAVVRTLLGDSTSDMKDKVLGPLIANSSSITISDPYLPDALRGANDSYESQRSELESKGKERYLPRTDGGPVDTWNYLVRDSANELEREDPTKLEKMVFRGMIGYRSSAGDRDAERRRVKELIVSSVKELEGSIKRKLVLSGGESRALPASLDQECRVELELMVLPRDTDPQNRPHDRYILFQDRAVVTLSRGLASFKLSTGDQNKKNGQEFDLAYIPCQMDSGEELGMKYADMLGRREQVWKRSKLAARWTWDEAGSDWVAEGPCLDPSDVDRFIDGFGEGLNP